MNLGTTSLLTSSDPQESLMRLLRQVSRSFYLTLRILPSKIRPQICLAYVLARIADTIADTDLVASSERKSVLNKWAYCVSGRKKSLLDFKPFIAHSDSTAERRLLERAPETLDLLNTMQEEDIALIRSVLDTIISGQLLDLNRFPTSRGNEVIFLDSEDDLDDYLYRVAGCVGEFWTKICFRHLQVVPTKPPYPLLQLAEQFGKGLQLVNILRDLHADNARGRCYLTEDAIARFRPSRKPWGRPGRNLERLMEYYVQRASSYLTAGWAYTIQLPASWKRVRLACAWPIMIGFETLNSIPIDDPFNPARRAKITRRKVRSIMARSILYQPFPEKWSRLVLTGSPDTNITDL